MPRDSNGGREHRFSLMIVLGWICLGAGDVTDAWEFAVAALCAFVFGGADYLMSRVK